MFIKAIFSLFLSWCDRQINQNKAFRRGVLMWAMWLVTTVVLRVTAPDVLPTITSPAATVIVAVIGILATVIGFYQWHRAQDDAAKPDSPAD